MKSGVLICMWFYTITTPVFAHEAKKPPEIRPVSIDTIDSDTLVSQFWKPNPSHVEAIVLKRRQRAKK